jgi:hypothetical protein
MKKSLILILFATAYLLLGCAAPALVVGQPKASIANDDVVVYYIDRPRCNFETVAHIRVTGGYFSLDSMFKDMRQQAATLGASGLYILHTQQLDVKEFLGTAKAIRCLPV